MGHPSGRSIAKMRIFDARLHYVLGVSASISDTTGGECKPHAKSLYLIYSRRRMDLCEIHLLVGWAGLLAGVFFLFLHCE